MDTGNFYDSSDLQMFPPKPKPFAKPKGMVSISLNFIFYLLIYFFIFNGDIKFLAAVLLVMFIHEFGHFVLMKKYGHNDRKMFFIPFMGMFLGQEERQVTLRQKMLILFFGPLPGIIVGIAALIFGKQQANEQLSTLAWVFLTWNLINLIPLDAMDGGQISEYLFPAQNFIIQLVTSVLIALAVIVYVILTHQVIALVFPVFLALKLQAMYKMGGLRRKLEEKGIDWRLNYEELNNKQYWLVRKELLTLSPIPTLGEMANEFTESVYEGMIMQNIKFVLLNPPYDDLGKNGRVGFAVLWAALFFIPLFILVAVLKYSG
jgi:stage IV sporulation protein FB